ncbi:MAG: shikimate kinase [Hyphomicrobiaceae bacterium]|nr:shikimate kinase [Hyphomicrobiaceae bacterium]
MMRFAPAGKTRDARAATVAAIRQALGTCSIVLVGMPGSGKSAAGKRLAPRLELPFMDADQEIERAAGKSIAEIFAEDGEPYFRDGERRVIARLLANGPAVIATGGGAFVTPAVRDNIRERGVSVWLRAELPLLLRRVQRRAHRPLLVKDPEGSLRRLMEARYPVYETADVTVEARDLPHEAIVNDIIDKVAEFLRARDERNLAAATAPADGTTAR